MFLIPEHKFPDPGMGIPEQGQLPSFALPFEAANLEMFSLAHGLFRSFFQQLEKSAPSSRSSTSVFSPVRSR